MKKLLIKILERLKLSNEKNKINRLSQNKEE